MAFHDFLADRQPNSCPGIMFARVQPLKDPENTLEVLRVDTEAIIADAKDPASILPLGGNADLGLDFPAELERVADQLLEHLHDLRRLRRQSCQPPASNLGVSL